MGPIHQWFELSYAAYLVIPRLGLDAMPEEWQQRFVDLLEEAYEKHGLITPSDYEVRRRQHGRFVKDPWANYRHGRIEDMPEMQKERGHQLPSTLWERYDRRS